MILVLNIRFNLVKNLITYYMNFLIGIEGKPLNYIYNNKNERACSLDWIGR
jgi:hypothetical protein